MGRCALATGELGTHNGLPATIIVSTTMQELQSGAGLAVTGGGSLLPMRDVIRLASHAHHYLAVFDQHTNEALYLGRTRRCASPAQRIVLHARDRGCTGQAAPPRATNARSITRSRTGRTTARPTSTTSPWRAAPTTASSRKPAGLPGNAQTVPPMESAVVAGGQAAESLGPGVSRPRPEVLSLAAAS